MREVLVGDTEEFRDDMRRGVVIDGREVFVFQRGGHYYAFENSCPHRGGPVGEGTVIGKVEAVLAEGGELLGERFSERDINIVCPWHGYEFDIATGECIGDRRITLRRYRAFATEGRVYVRA
jgi:nitrite reductase (NADH) small subunit